ncbi:hypothetical protein NEMBOFW57_008213 [Staphylotrichum longicolle]|uniref:Uncharacterized protein n=1 Tax=Staphylotrichum longicolle TaxID=669026 RepID=A0AAD4HVN2_9PEZI|nr:hypothetical protein NEMBOFW57_008213 [Staphylotrichum longicolle]
MSDRKGGNLFDMAKEGTKVPEDAGKPNVQSAGTNLPSQKRQGGPGGLGVQDNTLGATSQGEVVSAAGELPEDAGQKYSRSGGMEREQKHSAGHSGRNQP